MLALQKEQEALAAKQAELLLKLQELQLTRGSQTPSASAGPAPASVASTAARQGPDQADEASQDGSSDGEAGPDDAEEEGLGLGIVLDPKTGKAPGIKRVIVHAGK